VEGLETPRVVGNRAPDEAATIRFQASAQGVADKSFGLNRPKNYLAYSLAIYHDRGTADVLAEYVVRAVDAARTGAALLNLIDEQADGPSVTALGKEVIRFAVQRYGAVDAGLATFEDWQRSRKRFYDLAPEWGLLTRRVVWVYPATQLIVNELQTMHEDGISAPSLVDLVEWLHVHHPTFTVELFLRGTDEARRRALDVNGDLRLEALFDGEVYHSPTVFQLKAMLYHAGILRARGAEPHRLDPETDEWSLCRPLTARRLG
jgi:hypothetical protein